MMTAASLVADISENLGLIDHTLAPIKQLQKLSNSGGAAIFATSQPDQIVKIAVDLVRELQRVRNELKLIRDSFDKTDPLTK